MNENHNPFAIKRRKRIPIQEALPPVEFTDNANAARLHDLEMKSLALEERSRKLTERIEAYNLQVQQANSKTIQLERKIRGVLLHVKTTALQQGIPGARPRSNPQEQELELLRWKLSVIEKYMHGIFPEFV
jgi:predicted  nucleic acid-binding Zn-ribbon protein